MGKFQGSSCWDSRCVLDTEVLPQEPKIKTDKIKIFMDNVIIWCLQGVY